MIGLQLSRFLGDFLPSWNDSFHFSSETRDDTCSSNLVNFHVLPDSSVAIVLLSRLKLTWLKTSVAICYLRDDFGGLSCAQNHSLPLSTCDMIMDS